MSIQTAITPLESLFRRQIGQPTLAKLDREVIEQYQRDQLRKIIRLSKARSPFYQKKFQDVDPENITTLADCATLPLITEEEIRAHGHDMVCVSQDDIARIITMQSSGTTGPPKRICLTQDDLEQTLLFFFWGMQAMVSPGQHVAILLPGETPDSTGELLARALYRYGVDSTIIGLVSDPFVTVRQLTQIQPDVLVGFPVQILALARTARALDLNINSTSSVLLCSDYIAESLTMQLEELLDCTIFSHYGTVETGLGGAVDCQAHWGSHIRENDLLIEIIDPVTTQVQEDGVFGEIVITSLTRTGMPLIRYRTGDGGRILPGICPCGSQLKRLDRIQGRLEHSFTLQCGSTINMQMLDELLFPIQALLDVRAELRYQEGQETLVLQLAALPGREEEVVRLTQMRLFHTPPFHAVNVQVSHTPLPHIHPAKRIIYDKRQDVL